MVYIGWLLLLSFSIDFEKTVANSLQHKIPMYCYASENIPLHFKLKVILWHTTPQLLIESVTIEFLFFYCLMYVSV